ncbi:FkbM family methyltransferase [Aurantimonas sp. VKM B-3413]|uniref:FkbM family methyltransferase n=1 Tax=Aurantimonas sp. VKM B-3413 TaxID=2779401 RepID=UPI001E3CC5C9|nr:FkbM family methyltransferase [Aurantimonas sp. VKM B-3413]MCB8836621.1 FkbM family methyltransferase [Aurantimonas sp. VKM B-3413]
MSGLTALAGIVRSLRIYHGDRDHLAGLERLYRAHVGPGDLVFDVGAHVGDRVRVCRRLGARVVAVEPQPRLARLLRTMFAFDRGVSVVAAAVADAPGVIALRVNRSNPTVSTACASFVDAAAASPEWEGERWDETVEVQATTLDRLIAEHGRPAFVKIDVEGLEDRVLAGLSEPVRCLSFEFTILQRDVALRALARCEVLGYRRFGLSLGESHVMSHDGPISAAGIADQIRSLPVEANSGDVYCYL